MASYVLLYNWVQVCQESRKNPAISNCPNLYAIALLVKQCFQYLDNLEIQAAWNNLLKVLCKEWVAQEEFAEGFV